MLSVNKRRVLIRMTLFKQILDLRLRHLEYILRTSTLPNNKDRVVENMLFNGFCYDFDMIFKNDEVLHSFLTARVVLI